MNNTSGDRETEEISKLIRSEEDAALAVFRSRDFPARVMKAWRETRKTDSPGLKLRPAAVWVFVSAFLVVIGAAVLLMRRSPAPEKPPEFRSLVSVLASSPGASTLRREEPIGPADPGRPASSELVAYVLTALAAEESSREESEGKRASLPEKSDAPASLNLYQKMEILLKDKIIERGLLSIKYPSKEVIS